jgi:hypothetical protein
MNEEIAKGFSSLAHIGIFDIKTKIKTAAVKNIDCINDKIRTLYELLIGTWRNQWECLDWGI